MAARARNLSKTTADGVGIRATSDRRGDVTRLSTPLPAHDPAKDVHTLRDLAACAAGYHPGVALRSRFLVNAAAVQAD